MSNIEKRAIPYKSFPTDGSAEDGNVSKAGARMAAHRLKRFMKAFHQLYKLAKELGWESDVAKQSIDTCLAPLGEAFGMSDDVATIEKCSSDELLALLYEAGLESDPRLAPKGQTDQPWPADLNE